MTESPEPQLSFAAVSSAPEAEAHVTELCNALSSVLDRPVGGHVLASYAALRDEVEAGRATIAWAPPRVAIDLEDAGLASIDLCCVRGGQVYGSSDKQGGQPKDGRVQPQDLTATILDCLGYEPNTEIHDNLGRPLPLSRGEVIRPIL